jgi:hypothetical protein
MSEPMDEMFPSGGGMRGEPALVCVTYDSNGDPCGISGLPDFAESYVEALAAERDRLAAELAGGSFYQEKDIDAMQDRIRALEAQLAEARAEGWRRGIEAAAEVCTAVIRDYRIMKKDGTTQETARVHHVAHGLVSVAREDIRALPMPADLGAPA